MPSLGSLPWWIWRHTPQGAKRVVRSFPLFRTITQAIASRARRWASHDDIYTESYFRVTVERSAIQSVGCMAESIVEAFKPGTVLDVGCGTGALLQALRSHGVRTLGLEYAEAALRLCHERGL